MSVTTSQPAHRGQQVPINLLEKISRIQGHWQPHVVAEMNNYQIKVVKITGDFIWHSHSETDEAFIVLEGVLRIDFRDGSIDVRPGEMAVIPQGTEHKTFAAEEAKLLLIEPKGVPNTGDAQTDRTAADDVWV